MIGYILLGGALGAGLRHYVNIGAAHWLGASFPYGTMMVNILGSLIMGILVGLFAKALPVSESMRAFVMIGLLGGSTTFSSFSLDAINLFERGEYSATVLYIAGSVLLSVLALFAGLTAVRWLAA